MVDVTFGGAAADPTAVAAMSYFGGDTDPHSHGGDVTTEHFDVVTGTATGSDSGYAGGEILTTTTGVYTFEWTGAFDDD